ncbi:MAG: LLM class F420-dependent oxidoreductase [bacterium]|nr:LLM class F420-dependent oxidoreductase [bacterium]
MKIGIMSGHGRQDEDFNTLIAKAQDLEARGFDTLWVANIFAIDAITANALIGRETSKIELGTAVVPTYPRHPTALAQQALTAQSACDGRFTLGIGLSHQMVIEGMLGLSYERRAKHMREYLSVLTPLLRGEKAEYQGDEYRVHLELAIPGAKPVSTLIAALGEHMLKIAGAMADGSILWMTGPQTIETHVLPTIQEAANAAGRPDPRIVAGLPIVLTGNADAAREAVGKILVHYGMIPSYRAMLDREGAAGPADIALIGDEKQLDRALQRLEDVGVTDFDAAIIPAEEGAEARTLDYLQSRL